MGFGLAINGVTFSKIVGLKKFSLFIYRETRTLELLALLIAYCLKRKFNFDSDTSMYSMKHNLSAFFKKDNPQYLHVFFNCFCCHLYGNDLIWNEYVIPDLINVENKLYITFPLASHTSEIISLITREDFPSLFDKPEQEPLSFHCLKRETQIDSYNLKNYIFKNQDDQILMIALLPNNKFVKYQLYRFYTALHEIFNIFPFTKKEIKSKDKIYNYIITMKNFFKV